MKQQSLKRWIPVAVVIMILFWTVREIQYRHRFVENMEAEKLLSDSEKAELLKCYKFSSIDNPVDTSKLSNKAKVVVNTITDHPLSAVTDNVIGKMLNTVPVSVKKTYTPAYQRKVFTYATIRTAVLPLMFGYQDIYSKLVKIPSRTEFEGYMVELAKKNGDIEFYFTYSQKIIAQYNKDPTDKYSEAPVIIDLFGNNPQLTDTSGPLQRNVVDIIYAYFYPTPDFFTWLKKLIFG